MNTHLRANRWQQVSGTVRSITTGPLGREQLMWAGVLHAGPDSAIGGLTALELHGLRNWHRNDVTVLVAKSHNLESLPGVRFVETRRDIDRFRSLGRLPVWRVEPAALLFAAYEPVIRTAYGLLSAVVQQRLTDPARLEDQLGRLRPLRRAKSFRRVIAEIDGGAQSLAELDVNRMCRRHGLPRPRRQVRRRDSAGRWRYTDAEWSLPDGRVVVLEVDGAFHMDVSSWADDSRVVRDLRRVGVGRSSA